MNGMRKIVEKRIATAFIREALAGGCRLSVEDEDGRLHPSRSLKEILASMFQVDYEHLYVWFGESPKPDGWVLFVYGNGAEVISDYTLNVERFMTGARVLAEKYE